MADSRKSELLGLDFQELTAILEAQGEAGYRGRQLFEALYRQHISALEECTTISRELRARLAERYTVGAPRIEKQFASADGTIRYLMALGDGELVETVWMPEGDGGDTEVVSPKSRVASAVTSRQSAVASEEEEQVSHRATICISSQVGCAVNCQFCLTALLGVKRSLSAGEIVGQVITVLNERRREVERERINLVFMGMGEPFLNYENFMKAVRLLVEGVGIAESRMTVSTAGIVPRIYDFAKETVRPRLAISLNASNDEARNRLMPLNRKWNLEKLLAAAREFPLRTRERLTFEYVLLDGVNDADVHARQIVGLLRGIRAKVNLIALNPGPDIPFGTPSEERVLKFQQVLIAAGIPTFIRRPRGRDIYAACGQLKKTVA